MRKDSRKRIGIHVDWKEQEFYSITQYMYMYIMQNACDLSIYLVNQRVNLVINEFLCLFMLFVMILILTLLFHRCCHHRLLLFAVSELGITINFCLQSKRSHRCTCTPFNLRIMWLVCYSVDVVFCSFCSCHSCRKTEQTARGREH